MKRDAMFDVYVDGKKIGETQNVTYEAIEYEPNNEEPKPISFTFPRSITLTATKVEINWFAMAAFYPVIKRSKLFNKLKNIHDRTNKIRIKKKLNKRIAKELFR